jgi:hypothetical protein
MLPEMYTHVAITESLLRSYSITTFARVHMSALSALLDKGRRLFRNRSTQDLPMTSGFLHKPYQAMDFIHSWFTSTNFTKEVGEEH